MEFATMSLKNLWIVIRKHKNVFGDKNSLDLLFPNYFKIGGQK